MAEAASPAHAARQKTKLGCLAGGSTHGAIKESRLNAARVVYIHIYIHVHVHVNHGSWVLMSLEQLRIWTLWVLVDFKDLP